MTLTLHFLNYSHKKTEFKKPFFSTATNMLVSFCSVAQLSMTDLASFDVSNFSLPCALQANFFFLPSWGQTKFSTTHNNLILKIHPPNGFCLLYRQQIIGLRSVSEFSIESRSSDIRSAFRRRKSNLFFLPPKWESAVLPMWISAKPELKQEQGACVDIRLGLWKC